MEVNVTTPELVVVGIDGSASGQAALAWAAREATARGRQLCVVHCWQPDVTTAALPGVYPSQSIAWQPRATARAALDHALKWLRENHPTLAVSHDLVQGPAGPRLAAHLRANDLLVLGMSSRHRVTARLLGSTLEHLLRQARCQVVVVPPAVAVTTEGTRGPFNGQVVAAVHDPEDADDATEMATISAVLGAGFAAAALHQVPLEVVHADPRRPEAIGCVVGWATPVTPSTVRQPLNRAIESWHACYPQVAVRRVTVSGPPGPVLGRDTSGARLLVVGRSSHPMRPIRLLDHLLTAVSCPVAVTPPMPLTAHQPTAEERAALRLPGMTHPAWSTQ